MLQADLHYPRYLGVLNFGLKTADNNSYRGANIKNRGLIVLVLHLRYADNYNTVPTQVDKNARRIS